MKLLLEEIRRMEPAANETVDVVLELSKTAPFSYRVKKEELLDRIRRYATGATIASWSQICTKVGVSSSESVAAFMWKVAGDESGGEKEGVSS